MGKRLGTAFLAFFFAAVAAAGDAAPPERGSAIAASGRPKAFPHRVWAACDFESSVPDYAWFGPAARGNIAAYAGNATALGVSEKPYKDFSALMTGINPVPGPRMGKVNKLYLRYFLTGADTATFQYFSLSSSDNNHIRVSGLTQGKWAEVTMDFSRDGQRNDGTPGVPFRDGERMDDFKVFVGKPGDGSDYDVFLDDVIFFAEDPDVPPDPEPFPRRVIFLAAFDTGITPGERGKYWPGEFEIATTGLPEGSSWGVARAVPRKDGTGKWIRLELKPPRRVGSQTKLRVRYHVTGADAMTAQIFDVSDQDNRHVRLGGLKEGAWTSTHVDFTRDGRRNDGSDGPFAAGHEVDDLFFLVEPKGAAPVDLLIDEVVLYDAGTAASGSSE